MNTQQIHTKIKILKKGDKVLQVDWHSPEILRIVVQRNNGEIDLYSIEIDEMGLPRIDCKTRMTIAYGEDEIEIIKPSQATSARNNGSNELKVSTF
jgi:hypothetical protein